MAWAMTTFAPQRNADEQIDDQADDRAVRADGRYGRRFCLSGEIAYHRDVRSVKKLLQNGRRRYGQGKPGDFAPNGAAEHIQLLRMQKRQDFLPMNFLKSAKNSK